MGVQYAVPRYGTINFVTLPYPHAHTLLYLFGVNKRPMIKLYNLEVLTKKTVPVIPAVWKAEAERSQARDQLG